MSQWESLWKQCAPKASTTDSCTRRLREHLLAHLVCPGRHTVSALITVFGKQFQDWSADYLSSDNYKWFAATIKTDPWRQLPTGGHFQGEESLIFA